MKPAPFDYARASSLAEATALLVGADGEARALAGGQSIGPMLNLRLARPALLVDISRIAALKTVAEDDDGITVGATTVHADFEDGVVPDVTNGLMRRAASGIAYRAVRTRGTIGGSLAHADPAADWPPVMMALDAVIRIGGGDGGGDGGREVASGAFITGILTTVLEPGEIVSSIRIPRLSADATWGHYKVCVKPGDFADALGVVVIDRAHARCRAVLAGPTRPPIHLDGVAKLIAEADGWSDTLAGAIKDAARADLRAAAFVDEDDDYAIGLHATVAVRSAREALP